MTTLYGIPNCDTVKKARKWLEKENLAYQFHDFRKDGLNQSELEHWLNTLGAETLVNKRSTTWKQLSDSEKQSALNDGTVAILLAHPTLIKRPVLVHQDHIGVGFKDETYKSVFA